jgi:hypothetical protein
MDMQLDVTQQAIKESLDVLLARHAGQERAREVGALHGVDLPLVGHLLAAGFLDLFGDRDAGPLAAGLVTEWSARSLAVAPIGWRALVAPSIMEGSPPDVVAVAESGMNGPIRFAQEADALIVLDGCDATVVLRDQFTAEPVESIFGYPFATVAIGSGAPLEPGAGAIARRWWQVSVAAEVAGTTGAIVDFMLQFMKEREQFGKPLAAFQALQHRIVECYLLTQGVSWSAREAAFHRAAQEKSATAAILAVEAARRILQEAHQLSGAIGFTLEFDLHLWSMRLQALRVELGGIRSHAEALVQQRWS